MKNELIKKEIYAAYTNKGIGHAFNIADEYGLKYEFCGQCSCNTPVINNECLICGISTFNRQPQQPSPTTVERTQGEGTAGYQLAMSFKPFINPACTEHMEIVKDMAKSINNVIANENENLLKVLTDIVDRIESLDLDINFPHSFQKAKEAINNATK